jgi:hypothetical protein
MVTKGAIAKNAYVSAETEKAPNSINRRKGMLLSRSKISKSALVSWSRETFCNRE